MPTLNFKPQFAPMVRAGIDDEFAKASPHISPKCQTIRKLRKKPIKRGDTLHLYTGLRTKKTKKLGKAICRQVDMITIKSPVFYLGNGRTYHAIWLNDKLLTVPEMELLAKDDGFEGIDEFFEFFKTIHNLPFEGQLIKW